MLNLKRFLVSAFAVSSLLFTSIPVSASEEIYNDKFIFVEKIHATKRIEQNIDSKVEDNINDVLKRYVSNDIEGMLEIINSDKNIAKVTEIQNYESSYGILENYLNSNNVYIYSLEKVETSRSVGATDVQMSNVLITYNATNGRWSVTGGGYWKTSAYEEDAPRPSGFVGAKNVGGLDAVGFALVGTYGSEPTLYECSGYVHDGHGDEMTLVNPENPDSSQGVVFKYQDQVYFSNDLTETCYMGYGFAAQGIYESNFANYHGRARSYYAHTWNNSGIDSIEVGTGGISATWTNGSSAWEIYNNSDAVF